jgi:poly-gamma-glutamate synthesis protein (capsule biosynthesis protein)
MRKILSIIAGFIALLLVAGLVFATTVDIQKISEQEILPEPVIEVIKKVQPKSPEPVTMLAVGDMMLGRYVETLMNRYNEDYPFANLEGLVNGQDIVFGNLEGPIATEHVQTPDFVTLFSFKPGVAKLLKKHGFTLVSLANNHTLDKGEDVFEQTQQYLTEAGVAYFGNPRNESAAYRYDVAINERDLVFLGFNEAVNPFFDAEQALATVAAESEDVFVIVSMHWGNEYILTSNSFQQELAQGLIDNGADLVIGHHPHVVQEVEVYKDRMIFYSLGNFIFDQYFSVDVEQGLAFEMSLGKNEVSYELIPIQSKRSQPEVMTGEAKEKWLDGLASRVAEPALAEQVRSGLVRIEF